MKLSSFLKDTLSNAFKSIFKGLINEQAIQEKEQQVQDYRNNAIKNGWLEDDLKLIEDVIGRVTYALKSSINGTLSINRAACEQGNSLVEYQLEWIADYLGDHPEIKNDLIERKIEIEDIAQIWSVAPDPSFYTMYCIKKMNENNPKDSLGLELDE
jgi:hypothetical protein